MDRHQFAASSSSSQQGFLHNHNNNNASSSSGYNKSAPTTTGSVTTLHEAAAVFDSVSQRANRCSLQIATFKSHEQSFRRFLLERALPAADSALKERDGMLNRHEEDYGNAALRLKGVPVSAALGSPVTRRRGNESVKATDDPLMAELVATLKGYAAKHGQKGGQ